mgnify:FL=1|jgi:hypothetical protein
MKVKITIFNALDNIAKRHNVTDEAWAKSAKVRRPTISELRRMAIIANNNSDEKIGRACTLEKISSLFKGLYNILGGEMIKTDLLATIAHEKDQDVRLMIWSLILKDAPKETKDAIEGSMKIAAQTIKTKNR